MTATPPAAATARTLAVIPARYGSSRFEGKPLVPIAGQPMVCHVWSRVSQAAVGRVIVATDDPRILEAVRSAGGEAVMTRADHPSGTDRVWEVAATHPDAEWVLNVQGDEPEIDPAMLNRLLAVTAWPDPPDLATLAAPVWEPADMADPNIVKVVFSPETGRALYFSRAPIPCWRDGLPAPPTPLGHRHIGVYLYRREALAHFTTLPPAPLEQAECLEQLRALAAGLSIGVVVVERAPEGIDTPQDLERLLQRLDAVPASQ